MIARSQRLLANIQELAPGITSRAAEIEASRRIPPDLVEALRSIGIFRMFVPQSHGGLELDVPAALEIFAAISRIDGSVGWTAMIGGAHGIFAPLLPRDTYEQVYQNGPDVIIAGSAQPVGRAEDRPKREGRRWSAPSSCRRATGRSKILGTSQGSRVLGAITSHSGTRSSRRGISSISPTACRACRDRFIKRYCQSFR
jgi:indole-3-acetate monooxygenase